MPVSEKPRKPYSKTHRGGRVTGQKRVSQFVIGLTPEEVERLIAEVANPEQIRPFLRGERMVSLQSKRGANDAQIVEWLKKHKPDFAGTVGTLKATPDLVHLSLSVQPPLASGAKSNPTMSRAKAAIDLAVGLSAHAIGLLSKDAVSGRGASMDAALTDFRITVDSNSALQKMVSTATRSRAPDRGYVVNRSEAAMRYPVYGNFFPTDVTTRSYIRDNIQARLTADVADRRLQRSYWLTVFDAATALDGLADRQHSALHRMGRDIRQAQEITFADWQDYLGDGGPKMTVDRLVAMAWFDLANIWSLVRTMAVFSLEFRAAASLGQFARGGELELDSDQRTLLRDTLNSGSSDLSEKAVSLNSEEIKLLSASGFLKASMLQVKPKDWWRDTLE